MIAASIPVLRAFLKQKLASTRTLLRIGQTGHSKDASQRSVGGGGSLAKEGIRLSSKIAHGNSSNSRGRTYSELDDLDVEGAYNP